MRRTGRGCESLNAYNSRRSALDCSVPALSRTYRSSCAGHHTVHLGKLIDYDAASALGMWGEVQRLEQDVVGTLSAAWERLLFQQHDFMRQSMRLMRDAINAALRDDLISLEHNTSLRH
jgi:hypothetical protein